MKLFLQKQKKVGRETYNADLNNENHCEELNIHFFNIGKNVSSKIDPPLQLLMTFLMSLSPICVHSHQPMLMKSDK